MKSKKQIKFHVAAAHTTLCFAFLALIKILSRVFFRFNAKWINQTDDQFFKDLKLVALFNHTSLFEPIFLGVVPWNMINKMAKNAVVPAADVTMKRPVVGRMISLLGNKVVPITRKRDKTWTHFLKNISDQSIVFIAPEGRMKRVNGLDKDGKPMTLRSGIVDLIDHFENGNVLFAYSKGLHHVQAPGGGFPRLFRRVEITFEQMTLKQLRDLTIQLEADLEHKDALMKFMQERVQIFCRTAS